MTLFNIKEQGCACGRAHTCDVKKVLIGKNTLQALPHELAGLQIRKPFLLCDVNTHRAAGERVEQLLSEHGIPYGKYVFPMGHPEPDEGTVGAAVMHFDRTCDCVLGIGSGVIGDVSKILANLTGSAYVIVATAPSMDGYASATSSMTRGGLKVSLPSKCADVIIGDTDILKKAPEELLVSGLGDMLAKYISIAEWRISHLVTGEYYCEEIAELVRTSLKACVDHADGLLRREEAAVEAVFRGLVLCGMAMSLAGCSRPASGMEHYFSHLWDMRGEEFGTPTSTHGIQCAVATLLAARLYESVKAITPSEKVGLAYAERFDSATWEQSLRDFLGKGAVSMIELEKKERKYAAEPHRARLKTIVEHWSEITAIMDKEIPSATHIEAILDTIGCPKSPAELGIDPCGT